jgi:hypothetical protein
LGGTLSASGAICAIFIRWAFLLDETRADPPDCGAALGKSAKGTLVAWRGRLPDPKQNFVGVSVRSRLPHRLRMLIGRSYFS